MSTAAAASAELCSQQRRSLKTKDGFIISYLSVGQCDVFSTTHFGTQNPIQPHATLEPAIFANSVRMSFIQHHERWLSAQISTGLWFFCMWDHKEPSLPPNACLQPLKLESPTPKVIRFHSQHRVEHADLRAPRCASESWLCLEKPYGPGQATQPKTQFFQRENGAVTPHSQAD